MTRRAASLKQTRTGQNSLELQACGGHAQHPHNQQSPLMSQITTAMAANLATTTGTLLPKKSNWEVIEHFNSGAAKNRGGSVSSSLIAVGVTKCNLDDSVGSNFSGSTCNSPMVPRDASQKLLGNGKWGDSFYYFINVEGCSGEVSQVRN